MDTGATPTLGAAQDPIEGVLGGGYSTGAAAGDSGGGIGSILGGIFGGQKSGQGGQGGGVGQLQQYLNLVSTLKSVLGSNSPQQAPPIPMMRQAPTQTSPPPMLPSGPGVPPTPQLNSALQQQLIQRLLMGGGIA